MDGRGGDGQRTRDRAWGFAAGLEDARRPGEGGGQWTGGSAMDSEQEIELGAASFACTGRLFQRREYLMRRRVIKP